MARGWGLGPVFAFECVAAARRGRAYAVRALFVAMLLVGLGLIWTPMSGRPMTRYELSQLGSWFFSALVPIQLAMALLAAPAATAGAICLDRSRGTLDHVFVTDLTAREIVLGKLAARLASVLMILACGLPVLVISGLLGGIDARAAVGAYLVTLGVAVLGSALALTSSVWARKTHQALLPTYALLGLWVGAPAAFATFGLIWRTPSPGWTPIDWAAALTNPFFCALAPTLNLNRDMLPVQGAFLGVTTLLAWVLALVASISLRRVALGQSGRPARREGPGFAARLLDRLPEPPLDGNPVLWREWHRKRPSRWTGRLWTGYAVASGLASLFVVVSYFLAPLGGVHEFAAQVNAWEVAIGLLLLSVSAPLALAEERDRGSLDVVMATPLPTSTIVLGKWWGTYATVPRLAILPIWVTAALAMVSGHYAGLLVVIGMIFAPAAAITSLGLALATWIKHPGRAVAASVMSYVLLTVGWSLLMAALDARHLSYASMSFRSWDWETQMLANPFIAILWVTRDAGDFVRWTSHISLGWPLFWIAFHLMAAAVLMAATLATFDHCLGRVPEGDGHAPRLSPALLDLIEARPS